MDLSKAGVLVTGASGGIGQQIARRLAATGARMVVTGRRDDVLRSLADEVGGRAVVADLTDLGAAAELLRRVGPIDVLVSNAGILPAGRTSEFGASSIDEVLRVNLQAPMVMAGVAAAQMSERGHGHMVFISSFCGKATQQRLTLYNATKFGLRGYALSLRADLREAGVGVSVICPGMVREAGMVARSQVRLPWWVRTRSPDDVADAVLEAIQRDRAEIDVAPWSFRAGAKLAGAAPGLWESLQRLTGGERTAQALAEAACRGPRRLL